MKVICWATFRHEAQWGVWFRIFGYGLHISNTRPLFSERNGYRKVVRVFGVKIEALQPANKGKTMQVDEQKHDDKHTMACYGPESEMIECRECGLRAFAGMRLSCNRPSCPIQKANAGNE